MISRLYIVIYSCLLLLFAPKVYAQRDVPFALLGLEIYEVNQRVIIRCTIDAGSTCDGITIYRANGLPNFEKIGDIPGICGSASEAITYTFIDEQPALNLRNFYRIDFGRVYQSNVVYADVFDFGNKSYQIRHNTTQHSATILFENKQCKSVKLTISDFQGREKLRLQTTEEQFHIDLRNWPKGVYQFHLHQERTVSGKLLAP